MSDESIVHQLWKCNACGDERVFGNGINRKPEDVVLKCEGACRSWSTHSYSGTRMGVWQDYAIFHRVTPYQSKEYTPGSDSLRGGVLRKEEEG